MFVNPAHRAQQMMAGSNPPPPLPSTGQSQPDLDARYLNFDHELKKVEDKNAALSEEELAKRYTDFDEHITMMRKSFSEQKVPPHEIDAELRKVEEELRRASLNVKEEDIQVKFRWPLLPPPKK